MLGKKSEEGVSAVALTKDHNIREPEELKKLIAKLTKQMKSAAADLNFEAAAELRDKIVSLKKMLDDAE